MAPLKGKVALVTGASKPNGIGAAIALRLAREGADVVVADLCEQLSAEYPGYCRTGSNDDLMALAEKIAALGVHAVAAPIDVTDAKMVQAVAERVEKEFGRLNILCNNAGGAPGPQTIANMEEKAWQKTMEINLTGTWRVTKHLTPLLIKGGRGGAVVNTASRAGKVPSAFMSGYCTAKAGLIMLTKVTALEMAPHGIRVNCICPGQVETDLGAWGWGMRAFSKGLNMEQYRELMAKEIPLGRPASPDECANVVFWLVSEEASFITGQAINVTGGQLMEL